MTGSWMAIARIFRVSQLASPFSIFLTEVCTQSCPFTSRQGVRHALHNWLAPFQQTLNLRERFQLNLLHAWDNNLKPVKSRSPPSSSREMNH
jgi:hypothetical protein